MSGGGNRKASPPAAPRRSPAPRTGAKTAVRDWFIGRVAAETGLAAGEAAGLCCGDIVENGRGRAVVVRGGDGAGPRAVGVRKQFIQQARDYLMWKQARGESTDPDAPLFVSAGKRLSGRAVSKLYERSLEREWVGRCGPAGLRP